jgi:hypothetical protein
MTSLKYMMLIIRKQQSGAVNGDTIVEILLCGTFASHELNKYRLPNGSAAARLHCDPWQRAFLEYGLAPKPLMENIVLLSEANVRRIHRITRPYNKVYDGVLHTLMPKTALLL